MKLGQIERNKQIVAAIFQGKLARPVPDSTFLDLMRRSEAESVSLSELAVKLAVSHGEEASPAIPLHPSEVWGCGCTYKPSAVYRDTERGTREGLYAYVHTSARPEVFFKGTARVCVGPGQPIGIRSDSRLTVAEPELALVFGSGGKIIGYTIANDVSASDIEKENPLFLPQSKIFTACCALGPVIVTADELPNPFNLDISCTIKRGGKTIFSGSTSTSRFSRKIEDVVTYLLRSNPVPAGSVLMTGTGIITSDAPLAPGDIVSITIPEIGELSNVAKLV